MGSLQLPRDRGPLYPTDSRLMLHKDFDYNIGRRRLAINATGGLGDIPSAEPGPCLSYRIQAAWLLSGFDRIYATSAAEALASDPGTEVASQARELIRSLSS